MGIYTGSNGYDDNLTEVDVDMDELLEQFFYDDHYSDSDEEKRALFESSSELLEEKATYKKKTLVRLNKNDDLTRRTTMAALQLSKDANDNLWKALVGNRVKERKLLAAIKKKWGRKGEVVARKAQKEYIKNGGARGSKNSKLLKNKDISHRD